MIWALATAALALCLIPAAIVSLRGELIDRLVGLELTGVVTAQLCLLWTVAQHRSSFADVGLAVAVLAFGGGLVFARFLERWL